MEPIHYGPLTCHAIGIIMKEIVRRMIEDVNAHLCAFEVHHKQARDGSLTDVFTNIDTEAQAICVKLLQECFPNCGIIGEEKGLRIICTDEALHGMYFTIDPIDGTKAFIRKQSHGIGTMISLVRGTEIIAAYIGDIMTREIYGYRPESNTVHRISGYGRGEQLKIDETRTLASQYLLLRKRPEQYSKLTQCLIERSVENGLFADYEITSGSIGISTARLWKAEVGATLFAAGEDTPWDITPVMGICNTLGFSYLVPNKDATRFVIYNQQPCQQDIARADLLIIHHSRLNEFFAWQTAFLT